MIRDEARIILDFDLGLVEMRRGHLLTKSAQHEPNFISKNLRELRNRHLHSEK